MSIANYTCCSACGRKLHTTFFCQDCGHACCSLDCYCRHAATHAEPAQPPPVRRPQAEEATAPSLQPAR